MIGPPNHGSELAERFYHYAWFRMLYGHESIKQLFPSRKDFFRNAVFRECNLGLSRRAGDEKGYSDKLPGDDDGMVSVEAPAQRRQGFHPPEASSSPPGLYGRDRPADPAFYSDGKIRSAM